jgi:hypothetical protein
LHWFRGYRVSDLAFWEVIFYAIALIFLFLIGWWENMEREKIKARI